MNLPILLDALLPGNTITLLPEQFATTSDGAMLTRAVELARQEGERHNCEVLFGYADTLFVRFSKRLPERPCREVDPASQAA